ncbi:hypothetical protein J26TS2_02330 [Shouchella clausii]|uniref:YufK family protein n=1 Tax=Shouchella tritolerans TaxID=2979466 RepID=UPI0007894821|nr:YufK family protein [Shouchella tritolerans]GIN10366.1 hypothetical protein J26TS2_02330 [Shouchella clausii]
MTNRYLTGHLPLISILLFSLALALFGQSFAIGWLENNGILSSMTELIRENEIRLGVTILFLLAFFMLFSALKLIADTVFSLSLLFFSKDEEGALWQKVQGGAWIFLGASILSLAAVKMIFVILLLFVAAAFSYLLFAIYRIADSLTIPGLIGFVCFQLLFWAAFLITIIYFAIRLYNSFVASLPL